MVKAGSADECCWKATFFDICVERLAPDGWKGWQMCIATMCMQTRTLPLQSARKSVIARSSAREFFHSFIWHVHVLCLVCFRFLV